MVTDVKDVNQKIAEQMKEGIDKMEYGTDGMLSDPKVDSIAYVAERGAPWWVGTYRDIAKRQELAGLATGAEILEAAGLNDIVEKQPVYIQHGKKRIEVPNHWATVYQESGQPLGIVGKGYTIVQNSELAGIGDAIVDSGEAKYETAGSLRNGSRVFLSMELDHLEIKVRGQKIEDEIRTYLLLNNSHDGGMSLGAFVTPIRTTCWNTNNMAVGRARASFKMRHTSGINGKILAAREALGITFKYVELFKEQAQVLAMKKVVDRQVEEILREVWPINAEEVSEARLEIANSTKAFELYKSSPTLEGIRGTAWGALQAVTEYVDWGMTYKGRGRKSDEDVRAQSILFGRAIDRKERALKALNKI